MARASRGTSNVVTEFSSNITAVRWKGNKDVKLCLPALHYTIVIGCCTILKKISDTIKADNGLSKGHKEDVNYMDAKVHQSIFVKNLTLECIQIVLKHNIVL